VSDVVLPDGAADGLIARLDYPMYVVTTAADGEAAGCLAGFVTQCSIVPVRFLVCVSVVNHTSRVLDRTDALGLHLLGQDQEDLAELFGAESGDTTDKFARCRWRPGRTGVPVLADCAAWLEARVLRRTPSGDHRAMLVAPVAGGDGGRPGICWYHQVRHLHPGHPVTR